MPLALQLRPDPSLTTQDVALWWAYAEARSPRWRERFEPKLGRERYERLQHTTLYALPPEDQEAIFWVVEHWRRTLLKRYVAPAAQRCFAWLPASEIGNIQVMREIGYAVPLRLADYLAMPFNPRMEHSDPRAAAAEIVQRGAMALVGYPILGWDKMLESYVLIDGYGRCMSYLLSPAEPGITLIVCGRP